MFDLKIRCLSGLCGHTRDVVATLERSNLELETLSHMRNIRPPHTLCLGRACSWGCIYMTNIRAPHTQCLGRACSQGVCEREREICLDFALKIRQAMMVKSHRAPSSISSWLNQLIMKNLMCPKGQHKQGCSLLQLNT